MPKFKLKVVKDAEYLPNGKRKDAVIALIPENDAAMVTPQAREAKEIGAWVPSDPKAIEKAQERLDVAFERAQKRLPR